MLCWNSKIYSINPSSSKNLPSPTHVLTDGVIEVQEDLLLHVVLVEGPEQRLLLQELLEGPHGGVQHPRPVGGPVRVSQGGAAQHQALGGEGVLG